MNKKILWVSDLHIPYENKKAVKSLFKDLKENTYETIVLGGDIVDMISPSQFKKHPYEEGTLQNELNQYYKFMDTLRRLHKGKLIYLIGNHETRVQKYLKRNHELYGLEVLNLRNLLMIKEYDMKLSYDWIYKGTLFTHGRYAQKYSANKEMDINGMSGISGHVHRHQVQCKTDRSGMKIWISTPCMQDFNKQEFAPNPNWQTGYVKLEFNSKELIKYEVIFL